MFKPAIVREDGSYTLEMYEEEWRYIPGYEGRYAISNYGEVYSCPRAFKDINGNTQRVNGKMKLCHVNNRGYVSVNLSKNNNPYYADLHALVALAFLGPRPPGMEVCHNDGNRLNACLWNLRYDTRSANQADRLIHGTHQNGMQNASAIYTDDQIRNVMRLNQTFPQHVVARMTGIHTSTVGAIRQGVQWRHIRL